MHAGISVACAFIYNDELIDKAPANNYLTGAYVFEILLLFLCSHILLTSTTRIIWPILSFCVVYHNVTTLLTLFKSGIPINLSSF